MPLGQLAKSLDVDAEMVLKPSLSGGSIQYPLNPGCLIPTRSKPMSGSTQNRRRTSQKPLGSGRQTLFIEPLESRALLAAMAGEIPRGDLFNTSGFEPTLFEPVVFKPTLSEPTRAECWSPDNSPPAYQPVITEYWETLPVIIVDPIENELPIKVVEGPSPIDETTIDETLDFSDPPQFSDSWLQEPNSVASTEAVLFVGGWLDGDCDSEWSDESSGSWSVAFNIDWPTFLTECFDYPLPWERFFAFNDISIVPDDVLPDVVFLSGSLIENSGPSPILAEMPHGGAGIVIPMLTTTTIMTGPSTLGARVAINDLSPLISAATILISTGVIAPVAGVEIPHAPAFALATDAISAVVANSFAAVVAVRQTNRTAPIVDQNAPRDTIDISLDNGLSTAAELVSAGLAAGLSVDL